LHIESDKAIGSPGSIRNKIVGGFMTVAYGCVFVAAVLPYLLALSWRVRNPAYGLAANRAPRPFAGTLTGWRQRAHWAHRNGLETFAPFAAVVIVAHQLGAPQARVDTLAATYIGFRLAHAGFYLADLGVARSLVFGGGAVCTGAIFFSAV
jgi:uncharacterized MAPEG superfamily protein